jgi:hypothetical protein
MELEALGTWMGLVAAFAILIGTCCSSWALDRSGRAARTALVAWTEAEITSAPFAIDRTELAASAIHSSLAFRMDFDFAVKVFDCFAIRFSFRLASKLVVASLWLPDSWIILLADSFTRPSLPCAVVALKSLPWNRSHFQSLAVESDQERAVAIAALATTVVIAAIVMVAVARLAWVGKIERAGRRIVTVADSVAVTLAIAVDVVTKAAAVAFAIELLVAAFIVVVVMASIIELAEASIIITTVAPFATNSLIAISKAINFTAKLTMVHPTKLVIALAANYWWIMNLVLVVDVFCASFEPSGALVAKLRLACSFAFPWSFAAFIGIMDPTCFAIVLCLTFLAAAAASCFVVDCSLLASWISPFWGFELLQLHFRTGREPGFGKQWACRILAHFELLIASFICFLFAFN